MIILIIIILIIIYCYFQNTSIVVNKIDVRDSKIPKQFNDYNIIQISDLHNTKFGKNHQNLINKVKELEPDIIVITGDLIDSRRTNLDVAIEIINEIVKLSDVYFVNGNHESRIKEYDKLKESLIKSGVKVLENEMTELFKENEKINLIGLKDPAFISKCQCDEYKAVKESIETFLNINSYYSIMLSHRPEMFELYVENKIDLVLCGHEHGGQFRLPIMGGIVGHSGLFPKYTSGVYEKNDTKMIVSRGLGNSIIPIRINNRPEIVVVTLKSENNETF